MDMAYGGLEANRLILETEASIIPGETEEDGLLRKEYVLVGDTKAVEFDKAVDGKTFRLTCTLDTMLTLNRTPNTKPSPNRRG